MSRTDILGGRDKRDRDEDEPLLTSGRTIIEVDWHDSEHVQLGWDTREAYVEALKDRTTYRTCGYLVEETADHIMVALSQSDSGLFGDAIVIPTALVIARRNLAIP